MVALRTPTGPRRSRNRRFGHLGTIRVEIHLNRGGVWIGGRGAIISMIIGVWQSSLSWTWWKSRERGVPLLPQTIAISLRGRGNHLRRKVVIVEAWIKAIHAIKYYAAQLYNSVRVL